MVILTLNLGSSSLKFSLWEEGALLMEGEWDDLQLDALPKEVDAVGHRLVLGGESHAKIDADFLEKIRNLVPLAPLHLPGELAWIEKVAERHPHIPQVACFDTVFHKRMPKVAKTLPIPAKFGLHRLGFHGLSYEYICSQIEPKGRVVIAHLGSGCSLAAVRDGEPLDTTMGLTPTGGVVSATRSGDLDPGVLIYLLREEGMSVDELERCLNLESGFKAAPELFCYRIKKTIGAYAALMGGLDLLVFTGGIGAHVEPLRNEILDGLSFLLFEVRVMPTNEEKMIMQHVQEIL